MLGWVGNVGVEGKGALEIVNATRAYATGEGRYSKAQKIAVLHLHRYAYSGEPDDYVAFIEAAAVPRGDRKVEMNDARAGCPYKA